jgi:predicted MFS family arabinose efflux permease
MSGLGILAGLFLGGLLTGTLGWRWVFFINVPIGVAVLAGTKVLVDAERHSGRLDVAGAITSTGGMGALVYAITRGGEHGWTNEITVAAFAVAAVLLPIFVFIQARSAQPLMPLRLFRDRNRTGSYLGMLLLAFGPMGTFYLLTLYMQHVLAYSPLQTGLAWLPFGIGIVISAGITTKLVTKFAPRAIASAGMLISAAAVLWLSRIGHDASYATHVMPAIFLVAFGFGTGFIPLTLTAVTGVEARDAGIASALLNAAQQIGVALGLAVLSTVSVTLTAGRSPNALATLYEGRAAGDQSLVYSATDALVYGYTTALAVSSLFLVAAAILTAVAVNARRPAPEPVAAAPVH